MIRYILNYTLNIDLLDEVEFYNYFQTYTLLFKFYYVN